MERIPAEQEKAPVRRVDDPETFRAIAQIEGPHWVKLQEDIVRGNVAEGHYERSFQQAQDRFREGKAAVINGMTVNHWLVGRDGVVRFSERQAEQPDAVATRELLERVRALGFEIAP